MKPTKAPSPTKNGEVMVRQRYLAGTTGKVPEQADNFGVRPLREVLGSGGEMAGGEQGGEYGVTPLKSE